ncbi:LysM peptidoglycan-binding domain-containing protein [Frankia sp. AgKG'84/4]|uniref:LysM peptidoglycan-binding domain-containing protein n=1 Tax=Frankia sp. AgKG'84/4 TaxID=573490 RepID=UPI00200C0C1B|nr:LysM peptidoglycan-binding domain-containing protein [Frankia sp. AgKG'84/4]MCL9793856.1 LysM peptidoglycan-binding domain-containing protein [Frankia sp. AgKG'84/4]
MGHRLLSPDDGTVVLGAVRVLFWLGWLVFAGCALLDVMAQARRRPTVRLPGLGWMQAATGPLIATVALLVTAAPGMAAAAGPGNIGLSAHPVTVSAPVAGPQPAALPTASITRSTAPADDLFYPVRDGDSLWAIAGRHLPATASCPDPHLRWQEIFQLNRSELVHPDGRSFADPDLINPGWKLRMPADATGLASQPSAAPSGTSPPSTPAPSPPSPGDAAPGLIAPSPSATPAPQAPAPQAPAPQAPTAQPAVPGSASPRSAGQGPTALPTAPWGPSTTTVGPSGIPVAPPMATPPTTMPPAPITSPPITAPGQSSAPATGRTDGSGDGLAQPTPSAGGSSAPAAAPVGPEANTPDETHQAPAYRLPLELLGAGLTAAGLIWMLRRLRLRRQLTADLGDVPPLPSREAAAAEVAATAGADLDGAQFLHLALLALAAAAERDGYDLPDLYLARLTGDALDLTFATPPSMPPPAPYARIDEVCWRLGRTVGHSVLDPDGNLAETVIAPYPGLTLLGYTAAVSSERTAVLVDLEQVRSASVLGPDHRVADVLRFAALGLGTSGWATCLRLTLAGFEENLPAGDAVRVRTDAELAMTLAVLDAQATSQQARLDNGAPSILAARLHGAGPDPQLLLLAEAPDDPELADRLDALARPGPRVGIGILAAVALPDPGMVITVDDDGLLHIADEPAPVAGSLGLAAFSAVAEAINTATAACVPKRTITESQHTGPYDTDPYDTDPYDTDPYDTEPHDTEPHDTEPHDTASDRAGHTVLTPDPAPMWHPEFVESVESWEQAESPPEFAQPDPEGEDEDEDEDAAADARDAEPASDESFGASEWIGAPFEAWTSLPEPPGPAAMPSDRPVLPPTEASKPTPTEAVLSPPAEQAAAGPVPAPPVLIRLMGAVAVDGSGRAPTSRSHLRTATEILAYLALHEGAAQRQDLIDALWPAGRIDAAGRELPQPTRKTQFAHVSRARALAGTDSGGNPRLADADPGEPLRLSREAITDYQLFCQNRDAVWDRAGDDLIAGLQSALDLVRGPLPKPETRHGVQGGWLWLSTTSAYHHLPPTAIEAAVRLAEAYLHAGDAVRARDAVVKLLQFSEPEFVFDERLWQLRLLADFRTGGDEAAWATVGLLESMLRDRARYMDDEEFGEMSPELAEFIAELLDTRPATASSL